MATLNSFNPQATSTSFNAVTPRRKKYTLNDLRNDKEFQETTERFLTSIGEGEDVGDLFGYFRGADYNLLGAGQMVSASKKFTDAQKLDYQYLRNKFDNAEVGGVMEWVKAGANVTKEIATDPTMLASLFFVPWTGGTSFAARVAAGKVVQSTLKNIAGKEIAKGVAKGVAKIPGQSLKNPLTKNARTGIAMAEGLAYGSTASFTKQSTDVNTDRREEVNYIDVAKTGAMVAAIPFALRGAGASISKFNKSVDSQRQSRIDGGEDYKDTFIDKSIKMSDEVIEAVTPRISRLGAFIQKPTARFVKKMKLDPQLDFVMKKFRYDTGRTITGKEYNVAQEVSGRSLYEDVHTYNGKHREEFKKVITSLKSRGKVTIPKIGSRDAFFPLPFSKRGKKGATKQTRLEYQRISDETNDALAYYLRTGRKTVTVDGKRVSLEKAFNMTEKTSSEIAVAGKEIRRIISSIRRDSVKAGLDIGFVKHYLPRGFDYNAVKQEIKNLEKNIEGPLVKELKRAEGFKNNIEVQEVLEEIINPTSLVGKSYSELVSIGKGGTRAVGYSKSIPAMVKERKLVNIDETKISDYLDNNVENLVYDYIQQAGGYLQRKIHLGEDLAEFNTRFVQPIIKTLESKGSPLTSAEIKTLENIYLVTTGQVAGIDNAAMRTLANVAIVGNQLALLPLATVTSLSEVAVPLVRGAGKKFIQKGKGQDNLGDGGIRLMFESGNKYRKMWWDDIVKKDLPDSRPQALKELNRFSRALDRAGEDRALAMYGQGFGRRATQAQNKFFKLNLLHDWTRFVQMTSFNVGKSKMYENLFELATDKRLTAKKTLRLENELKELGVDVVQGKKWVRSGGKPSGKFYDESFLPSAARYVDEVIMNPTAAANQKPLWHSMPSTRWAFGLMGFPTAFSNTVIKNAVREVGKDIRSGSLHATPSVVMGATTMLSIAMFGNTLRTGGRNIEKMEEGTTSGPFENSVSNEVLNAALRTGMVGPFESSYRASQDIKYNSFVAAVLKNFTGPAVNDILDLASRTEGLLTVALDKIPAIGLLKTTNPEGYKEIKKAVRALDPTTAQNKKEIKEEEQAPLRTSLYYKGGEVEVPYTKDEPEDRVDKFTGRPYSDQIARLGFAEGRKVNVPYTKDEPEERINPFTGEPYTAIYKRRTGLNEGGTPLTFNQQYHRDTIANKKAFQDINGNVVTANVIGVEYKGKIYNLPSYDRNGGFFTPEELKKKYEVEMETGVIKGYNKKFDGAIEDHPANVAARNEHKLMEEEAELAREAVKYKNTPSKEIGRGFKAGMKALLEKN